MRYFIVFLQASATVNPSRKMRQMTSYTKFSGVTLNLCARFSKQTSSSTQSPTNGTSFGAVVQVNPTYMMGWTSIRRSTTSLRALRSPEKTGCASTSTKWPRGILERSLTFCPRHIVFPSNMENLCRASKGKIKTLTHRKTCGLSNRLTWVAEGVFI